MSEEAWMFDGGDERSYTIYIGKVVIVKRTTKRVYLAKNDGSKYSGYRECVPVDEVYANEEDCREAAAKRVAATKALLDAQIERMTRAVLGQPEKKEST